MANWWKSFRIIWAYYFFPVFIISSDDMPTDFKGETFVYPFVIFIRLNTEYFNNWNNIQTVAIIAHELQHAHQGLFTLFTHGIWYNYNKKYRLWAECKGYLEQMHYLGIASLEWIINAIINDYNLGLTLEDAPMIKTKLMNMYNNQ